MTTPLVGNSGHDDWGKFDRADLIDLLMDKLVRICNDAGKKDILIAGVIFDFRVIQDEPYNNYILRGTLLGKWVKTLDIYGSTLHFLGRDFDIFAHAVAHDMTRLLIQAQKEGG